MKTKLQKSSGSAGLLLSPTVLTKMPHIVFVAGNGGIASEMLDLTVGLEANECAGARLRLRKLTIPA